MARRPRVQVPGFYHVVARGNGKQEIFDDYLRPVFLVQLGSVAPEFDWRVLAWAVMSNHVHLVLRIGDLGLAGGMQKLNLGFALKSNARFGRINHCFGSRYWSTYIESEEHLARSIRYALWNPARAGICKHPAESNWTSFAASAGLVKAPRVLALDALLDSFGKGPAGAFDAFRDFVYEGRARCLAPWNDGAGILR
jgi:REP element-mobilizing transposase RayT